MLSKRAPPRHKACEDEDATRTVDTCSVCYREEYERNHLEGDDEKVRYPICKELKNPTYESGVDNKSRLRLFFIASW